MCMDAQTLNEALVSQFPQPLAGTETHAIVARICSEFALEVVEEGTTEFSILFRPAGVRLRARRVI